jgi:thioredoxin 1
MTRSIFTIAMALTVATSVDAFSPSARGIARTQPLNMAAIDVSSESEFDAKISGAGDKLVIIDYSTTWCGPCKVIAPKFDELSEKYSDSIFVKVR